MSDIEEGGKKSGYRLEYAGSARAKCKGAWAARADNDALAAIFLECCADCLFAMWSRTEALQR